MRHLLFRAQVLGSGRGVSTAVTAVARTAAGVWFSGANPRALASPWGRPAGGGGSVAVVLTCREVPAGGRGPARLIAWLARLIPPHPCTPELAWGRCSRAPVAPRGLPTSAGRSDSPGSSYGPSVRGSLLADGASSADVGGRGRDRRTRVFVLLLSTWSPCSPGVSLAGRASLGAQSRLGGRARARVVAGATPVRSRLVFASSLSVAAGAAPGSAVAAA